MKLGRKVSIDQLNGLLGQGTSLTGELTFSGMLRIDGNVHGSIMTTDTLIIGEGASIHADIKAEEVKIYGAVFGNVEGAKQIAIHSTGSLQGDVMTPQLVIEAGGTFQGRSRNSEESEPATEEATTEYGPVPENFPTESHWVAPPAKTKTAKQWLARFKPKP